MHQASILRIVVASPSDVQAERKALSSVVDELNHGIARDRGLQLSITRWEDDAYAGFHPQGPQGLIDAILRIDDCDIFIGMFWKRFGTPVHDAKSGTAHEFQRAYDAWLQQRRPHIMMFFNQTPYMPQTSAEAEQGREVLAFRESFPQEGLWWPYQGEAEFQGLVRRHLTQFILQELRPSSGTPSHATQPQEVVSDVDGRLRESYLAWLITQVRAVPLSGIDPKSIPEETRRDLDLAAVYTALMTQQTEAADERNRPPEMERQRLSAMAVLNAEPHLALLGDPGSGKTTFVNFVALCMAGELLGRDDANLTLLRAPLSSADPDQRRGSEEEASPQPWDHGPLLPVRVVLREFVARSLTVADGPTAGQEDVLWRFILNDLPEPLRDVGPVLQHEWLHRGGVLLLDGLDEVPEADRRREEVKAAIERFVAVFPRVRVLVTSRTYAYQRQDWKLNRFREAVLAPFDEGQIQQFVERWYAYVGQVRHLSADEMQGRAVLLNAAIAGNPRLFELATRPLLLTLMASLHAWRGGTLPEQREALYADAVDLLLDRWESQKLRRRADGSFEVDQPSLAEWLRVEQQTMRQMLNRLAFEAHRGQAELIGTADVAQDTLVTALMRLNLNPDARPVRLIEFLSQRAGILEPRGVSIYTFPHRTFQEYLAACHLTDFGFPDELADLLRDEPNRWREVVLLAGAKAARGTVSATWTLADALCYAPPPAAQPDQQAGYWGALLAAQVLIENRSLEHVVERHRLKVDRIRQWLVRTLEHGALSPVDRAQAGNALSMMGDPRFREDAWYLPDDPLLGFVEIPAGPFLMGSDKARDADADDHELPHHEVRLPRYFIGRYPVTVAQFRAYVEASGYRLADENSLRGVANHPVVRVSWHEARRYCEWLTAQLRVWEGTPEPLASLLRHEGCQVMVPSEAEWEKAARGADGRLYPWGNEPDPNRANYVDTEINTTSAVGCFPGGASPYGVHELSGNVWEWTRSLWGDDFFIPAYRYLYKPNDGRENPTAADNVLRVLRGGAFNLYHGYVRCAYRGWRYPLYPYDDLGFRVGVLPGL
jgi:formylglycine-generating enzyme required for sulfatase activity